MENEIAKVGQLEKQIEMQDKKIEAQDLTIHALKTMVDERLARVDKNLKAINPGEVGNNFHYHIIFSPVRIVTT